MNVTLILAVYVEDLIIATNSYEIYITQKQNFAAKFQIKNLGLSLTFCRHEWTSAIQEVANYCLLALV